MLILKYINLFLVFGTTFFIGYLISKRYSNRVSELKELQTGLDILENKIKFTYEPLQEIFSKMSEVLKGNIGVIFRNININLKNNTVEKSFTDALNETESNLNLEDKKVIENLSKMLGKTEKEGQISQIVLAKTFIKTQIKKAEKEEEKNSKLYKTLGATIGLAFVIILI